MIRETCEYFVVYLMAPIILAFGLIGNLLGIIALTKREKLIKIGSRNTFRYLLILDSFYLVQILQPYLAYPFKLDLTLISNLTCRLFYYLNYSLDVISPWLLVYISVERYVSIGNHFKRNLLRRARYQRIYLLVVFAYNMCYYLPFAFSFEIQALNEDYASNSTARMCKFKHSRFQLILTSMDMVNRVLVPFTLMSVFTVLIILTVFESRNKVIANYKTIQNRTFKRDLKFSLTCLLMNFIYFTLSLIISVFIFVRNFVSLDVLYYLFALYLFYMCYACNFYLILASNTLFRSEFFMLFKRRKSIISVNKSTYKLRNSKSGASVSIYEES